MTEYGTIVHFRKKDQQFVETKQFWGDNHAETALKFLNEVFSSTNYHVFTPVSREVD
jgi:hypothetical protein